MPESCSKKSRGKKPHAKVAFSFDHSSINEIEAFYKDSEFALEFLYLKACPADRFFYQRIFWRIWGWLRVEFLAFKSAKPGAGLSLCAEISLPINPPHIHAEYQGHEALVEISTGHILEGGLPKKSSKACG